MIGDESELRRLPRPARAPGPNQWVGPLSALSFNHGRTGKRRPYFQASPARFAAQAFEKALKRQRRADHGEGARGHDARQA